MFGDLIRRFRRMSRSNKIVTLFFVTVAIAFGGAKPIMSYFRFMQGLRDDGCYVKGELVHVEWVKTGIVYVPDDADLYVDAREHGDTDDDHWQLVAQATVGDYMVEFAMPTNAVYDFNVWYYYDPAPASTNGVWKYSTVRSQCDKDKIVPARATVIGDGRKLTPGGMMQ